MFLFLPNTRKGRLTSFHRIALTLFAAAMMVGCRKHDPFPDPVLTTPASGELQRGLPPSIDSLHGFLVAENRITDETNLHYWASRVAMFAHPGVPLMEHFSNLQVRVPSHNRVQGNIDVGVVSFGSAKIPGSGGNNIFNYFSESSAAYMDIPEPVWKVEGNKSVRGFTVALDEWPVVYDTVAVPTVTNSLPWSINLNQFGSGYDSVIVELRHQSSSYQTVSKRTLAGDSIMHFSKEELQSIYSFHPRIAFRACRYFHITIEGRLYVFELIRRFDKNITGTP